MPLERGEIWAYRSLPNAELVPARIMEAGRHYDALVQIHVLRSNEILTVRRRHLPCLWDEVETHLANYNFLRAEEEAKGVERRKKDAERLPDSLRDRDLFVLATIDNVIAPPIAYNLAGAAAAVGYSVSVLRQAIDRGELTLRYANSKPVILREELEAWARALPLDPPGLY